MKELSFSALSGKALEELAERMYACEPLEDADIAISDGVLSVGLADGAQFVINRQEPLRQIWLSSPEGPARFDYAPSMNTWHHESTGDELIGVLNGILSRRLGTAVRL